MHCTGLAICMAITLTSFSQSLAQSLDALHWSSAGLTEVKTPLTDTINILDYKNLKGNQQLSFSQLIHEIQLANPRGCLIHFPEGTYVFNEQIQLFSNCSLQGDGMGKTIFRFNLLKDEDCIRIEGKKGKNYHNVTSELLEGAHTIVLKNSIDLEAGDALYLIDDDQERVESDWSVGKTGQIVTIADISSDTVFLHENIRRNFSTNSIKAWRLDMVENVQIKRLTVINNRRTSWQSSNILLRYARNCKLEKLNSIRCNYAHVQLEFSTHCEVLRCQLEKAHEYGNGGKAYGIALQFASGDCVIGENKTDSLRHAFVLQAGANGNVIAANYTQNPYWTEVRLPEDSAGDIVFHGNYPYYNLVINNKIDNLVIDGSHGINGPQNVFYLNEMRGYGIFIHRRSDGQFIIENLIQKQKWPRGRYRVRGQQYEKHNRVGEKIKPRKSRRLVKRTYQFR